MRLLATDSAAALVQYCSSGMLYSKQRHVVQPCLEDQADRGEGQAAGNADSCASTKGTCLQPLPCFQIPFKTLLGC